MSALSTERDRLMVISIIEWRRIARRTAPQLPAVVKDYLQECDESAKWRRENPQPRRSKKKRRGEGPSCRVLIESDDLPAWRSDRFDLLTRFLIAEAARRGSPATAESIRLLNQILDAFADRPNTAMANRMQKCTKRSIQHLAELSTSTRSEGQHWRRWIRSTVRQSARYRRKCVIRGTYAANRWLAEEECDDLVRGGCCDADPELAVRCHLVVAAMDSAVWLLRSVWDRRSPMDSFVAWTVRLEAAMQRMQRLFGKVIIPESWPSNPGIVFCGSTGQGTIDTAFDFANRVYAVACIASFDAGNARRRLEDDPTPLKTPTPLLGQWRERMELATTPLWPNIAEIFVDHKSLRCRLDADLILARQRVQPDVRTATNEHTQGEEVPDSLSASMLAVIATMATFDPHQLVSTATIADSMPPTDRRSQRTIGSVIRELIARGLVERPAGTKSGARLTPKGRRLAGKIAE